MPFDAKHPAIELRLKLECLQETGSFKSRGAWNQLSLLEPERREAGVIATSSGNHGRALAWAAERAGVRATIVMPKDAYPNKIQACRDHGAEVVLGEDRPHAEAICRERVEAGASLIHPYDDDRTIEGAGTVGLEIAEDWPEVECVVIPVGGGGLIAGSSLAIRRRLGQAVRILGAEPSGAPTLARALEAGAPVPMTEITTGVQGLCPLSSGVRNTAIAMETVDNVLELEDELIFAAQARLVNDGDWVVEPAGAATSAAVFGGRVPADLLEGRSPSNPLRVAAVVSGGNPDPAQLESLRSPS